MRKLNDGSMRFKDRLTLQKCIYKNDGEAVMPQFRTLQRSQVSGSPVDSAVVIMSRKNAAKLKKPIKRPLTKESMFERHWGDRSTEYGRISKSRVSFEF